MVLSYLSDYVNNVSPSCIKDWIPCKGAIAILVNIIQIQSFTQAYVLPFKNGFATIWLIETLTKQDS